MTQSTPLHCADGWSEDAVRRDSCCWPRARRLRMHSAAERVCVQRGPRGPVAVQSWRAPVAERLNLQASTSAALGARPLRVPHHMADGASEFSTTTNDDSTGPPAIGWTPLYQTPTNDSWADDSSNDYLKKWKGGHRNTGLLSLSEE